MQRFRSVLVVISALMAVPVLGRSEPVETITLAGPDGNLVTFYKPIREKRRRASGPYRRTEHYPVEDASGIVDAVHEGGLGGQKSSDSRNSRPNVGNSYGPFEQKFPNGGRPSGGYNPGLGGGFNPGSGGGFNPGSGGGFNPGSGGGFNGGFNGGGQRPNFVDLRAHPCYQPMFQNKKSSMFNGPKQPDPSRGSLNPSCVMAMAVGAWQGLHQYSASLRPGMATPYDSNGPRQQRVAMDASSMTAEDEKAIAAILDEVASG